MANLNQLLDRARDTAETGLRQATGLGKNALHVGTGLVSRVRGGGAKPDMDDATLSSKVETELFRGASARKGKIDVNVVDGVVWLRGEAKNAAEIKSIEAKVAAIPEVRGVENLLHQPKTPAPSRTRSGAKKTTTKKAAAKKPAAAVKNGESKPAERKFERTATNESKKAAASEAEPAPADLAARREGRQPAPLGSTKTAGTSSSAAATGGVTPTTSGNAGNGSSSESGSGSTGS